MVERQTSILAIEKNGAPQKEIRSCGKAGCDALGCLNLRIYFELWELKFSLRDAHEGDDLSRLVVLLPLIHGPDSTQSWTGRAPPPLGLYLVMKI